MNDVIGEGRGDLDFGTLVDSLWNVLKKMDERAFQRLITDYFYSAPGFFDMTAGPDGPDRGRDIEISRYSAGGNVEKINICCTKSTISREKASSFIGTSLNGGFDVVIFASPKDVSSSARTEIELHYSNVRNHVEVEYSNYTGRELARTLLWNATLLSSYFPEMRHSFSEYDVSRLAPSFECLWLSPPDPIRSADYFYDGFPASWSDLALDLDITRDVYAILGGIRDRIIAITQDSRPYALHVALMGVAGTGKSTLLRRAAFDAQRMGSNVLYFRDRGSNDDIWSQVKEVSKISRRPIIVCIDDASIRFSASPLTSDQVQDLLGYTKVPIMIITADESVHWFRHHRSAPIHPDFEYQHFNIGRMSHSECAELLQKMIYLEDSGAITKRVEYDLSLSQRMDLVINKFDRVLLVVLLTMRHGVPFENVVKSEYDRLSDKSKVQFLYALVAYMGSIGVSTPVSLALRASGINMPNEVRDAMFEVDGLLLHEQGAFRTRHRVIGRRVASHAFNTPQVRISALELFVCNINPELELESESLTQIAVSDRSPQRILEAASRSFRLVDDFGVKALTGNALFKSNHINMLRTLRARCLLIFGEFDRAEAEVDRALSVDPSYVFALRQKAWINHTARRSEQAIVAALNAAAADPDTPETLFQSARVLHMSNVRGFKLAGDLYQRAISIRPGNVAWIAKYEAWQRDMGEFERLYGATAGSDLPMKILENARPGIGFWRNLLRLQDKLLSKKMYGYLFHLQARPEFDPNEYSEAVEGFDPGGDRDLAGLIYANEARARYTTWYKARDHEDMDELEGLFRKSISLFPENPFVYSWLGTFLKECRSDAAGARRLYDKALRAAKGRDEEDHPMFLNNKALLILEAVDHGSASPQELFKARELLRTAVLRAEIMQSPFPWAQDNLSLCEAMIVDSEKKAPLNRDA